MTDAPRPTLNISELDHIVHGVLDLPAAVARFGALTGVTPVEGGRHLGLGTRNYLVGLTNSAYLEIIALDDEHPVEPGRGTFFHVDRLTRDRTITWAIHPTDPEAALRSSTAHGADHGPLLPMSRQDPTGNTIRWGIANASLHGHPLPYGGLAPFVLSWEADSSPAPGLPKVQLVGFGLVTPAPHELRGLLDSLGLAIPVTEGPPAIDVTVRGPGGELSLRNL